ncbi:putative small lipoprotein YifL [Nakamurella sp. UYEF19]|uniref:META domain-containing protein n=1 Tax=Nakamurella sp. UYEF19 TaxID=1756392 RepID=UPI003393E2E6
MRDRSRMRCNVAVGVLLAVTALASCGNNGQLAPPADSSSTPSVQAEPLAGTAWQLDDSRATFKITGDQLLATNGCQYLQGAITIQPDVITIKSPVASAGPVCATVDQPGLKVFPVLTSHTVHWQVIGDHLKLTDADGHALEYSSR